MASSKDITIYNEEEIAIVMLALLKNVTLTLPSKQEATYLRSRVYAVRTAAIHCWEKKQRLAKTGLSTTHLDIPIVDAAQEVMSITVMREGDCTLTIGRRLGRPSLTSILQRTLREHGAATAEETNARAMKEMEERLRMVKPEAEDDTLATLGYGSRHSQAHDEPTDSGEDSA